MVILCVGNRRRWSNDITDWGEICIPTPRHHRPHFVRATVSADEMLARKIIVLFCSWLLYVGAADAQSRTGHQVGNWVGAPTAASGKKQVERCTATASNAQNIAITYSIDGNYRWRLAISSPAWGFSEGYVVTMLLRLGEKVRIPARATVGASRQLEIQTEDDLALFAALWGASKLQVTAGGLTFEFDLFGNNEVLRGLLQCLPRQPMSAASKNRSGQVTLSSGTDEVRSLAGEMLGFARIQGAQISAGPSPGSASWKAGLVTSTLSAVAGSQGSSRMHDVAAGLIRSELNRCRGAFLVWALQEVDQTEIARTFTVCPGQDGTTFAYSAAMERAQGGFYLLQSAAIGGGFAGALQQEVEQMDARLRPAFVLAIKSGKQRQ